MRRHDRGRSAGIPAPAALACLLALLLALGAAVTAAHARAFTVEDLLRLEGIGQAGADPQGRWMVFERLSPVADADWFEADITSELALSRLFVVDLAHPAQPRPLITDDSGKGVVMGAFSPSGDRLAVYRFSRRTWRLGVVDLRTRAVTWTQATPEDNLTATTVAWLDERTLLVLDRADGRPPWYMRKIWEAAERLPERWAQAAQGRTSASVHGSGRWRPLTPPRVPNRLLRVDAVTGGGTVLATGDFSDLEMAPGGRRVALLERGAPIQLRADAQVQGPYGMATEQHRLAILDLATGMFTRPALEADIMEGLLAWSDDGVQLLAYARDPGAPWAAGRLVRYDTRAAAVVPVPAAAIAPDLRLRPEEVRAGWMGRDPVVFGRPAGRPQARADWFRLAPGGPLNLTAGLPSVPATLSALDPRSLALLADGAAWRVDPSGKARRLGGPGLEPAPLPRARFEGRRASAPPRRPLGPARTDGASGVTLVSVDAGPARPPLALPPDARLLAYSGRAQAALVLTGPRVRRQALSLVTPRGQVPLLLTNPHLEGVDPPRIAPVAHTGPDGQSLQSWLFLPPQTQGAAPPPLVVRPYPGAVYAAPFPETPFVNESALSIEALVGKGYAVLLPSLPIPRRADFWTGFADQVLAIVDAAAQDPRLAGAFDPSRLALWGHSYGGYGAALMVSQSDRFRTAILQSAPTDLAAMHGAFQPSWRLAPETGTRVANGAGWTEDSQGGMGAPPWAAPSRYVAASPVYQAGSIRAPLLMFRGDQDFVSLDQAEMLFAQLYRQGRDALLVTYWGEGHALGGPGAVRDRYARIFDWLAHYLGEPTSPTGRLSAETPLSSGPAPANVAPTTP